MVLESYFDNIEGTFIGIVDAGSGVSSIEKLDGIKIFPNPAKENLMVVASSYSLPFSVEIYNVLGNKINAFIQESDNNITTIDLNGIKSGVYFLRMKLADNSVVIRKFTKNWFYFWQHIRIIKVSNILSN